MPLTPGLLLGPYEIQTPIGAGGMGEVYRARDTRLERTVAIKVLPTQLAADPQFRERFDREARAISALEHPHICSLYDVGEHAPSTGSEQAVAYLVMQYLEGETLDARLSRGALPLEQALQIATQIADALDRAHRAGIVHRDLKPGNVMLTKTGAKLLDFGLAKSTTTGGRGVTGLSMLPTTPPGLTAQGTILGTFQYMAPEQLEGHEADARTDIFAFGAVLYEMLTGRKAFEGRSQASLIGAILKDDPPPPSSLQPLAPDALDRLVRICLAKDPDDRWQSARDLHRELAWLARTGSPARTAATAGPTRRQLRLAQVAAAIFATAFVAAVGVLISERVDDRATAGVPVRFIVPLEADRQDDYSAGGFALSPDGRSLAYVDGAGPTYTLFVRSIGTLESRALVTSEDIKSPFWSPDGRFLAFFSGNSLRKVDVSDRTTQTISPLPGPFSPLANGGTWGHDDVILAAWSRELYRIPASGGMAMPVGREGIGLRALRWPQFLPDGRRVLYSTDSSPSSGVESGVYVASLDGATLAQPVRVLGGDYPARYVEPGYLVFIRDGVLFAQRFDVETASLQGTPVTLAPRVAFSPDVNVQGADFSPNGGGVAYRTGWTRRRLTWLDRSGRPQSVIGEPDNYVEAELSPDGTRIALEINEENGLSEIWVMDAVAGTRVPLTRTADEWEYAPRWSPDGRHIAYSRVNVINRMLADGSGVEEPIAEITPPTLVFSRQWTPDGRSLLFAKMGGGLFTTPASPNSEASDFPGSSTNESSARVSPNGRWLAYTSDESGRREVYVRPFGGGARTLVSTAGGGQPLWNGKGTELYYLAADGAIMAAGVKGGARFQASPPKALFSIRPSQMELRQVYSTIDGDRFLVRTPDTSTPPSIVWLSNWPALVGARR